jgi:cation diffusion facilitator CzcD-associated flavoprotein CzcO
MQMGVVGRGGRKLTDHWAHGQRAYIGMATHGFPNLFHINGPQSAAALFNNPIAIEDSVDFVANLIAYAAPVLRVGGDLATSTDGAAVRPGLGHGHDRRSDVHQHLAKLPS